MAGIPKKGYTYYCTFRFQGRRYYFTVGKVPEAQIPVVAVRQETVMARSLIDRYFATHVNSTAEGSTFDPRPETCGRGRPHRSPAHRSVARS